MTKLQCFLPPGDAPEVARFMHEQRFRDDFPVLYARALFEKISDLKRFFVPELEALMKHLASMLRCAEQAGPLYPEQVRPLLNTMLNEQKLTLVDELWIVTAAADSAALCTAFEYIIRMIENEHAQVLAVPLSRLLEADVHSKGWHFYKQDANKR